MEKSFYFNLDGNNVIAKQCYALDEIVFVAESSHPMFKNLRGLKFGRLKVLGYAGFSKKKSYWYCICDCEKIIKVGSEVLRSGHTKSCGCLMKEVNAARLKTHGNSRFVESNIYREIKRRCTNIKHCRYKDYGGRGITLDLTFEEFLDEVGSRPSAEHSIDRINNNKPYQRGNIRWATKSEQANNKRSNVFLYANGHKKTCTEWAKELGISANALQERVREGWCDLHAIAFPIYSRRPKNCPDCNKSRL